MPSTISSALLRLPAATRPITWTGTEGAAWGVDAVPAPSAPDVAPPKSLAMARGSPTGAVPPACRDGPSAGFGAARSIAQWAIVTASAAPAQSVANQAGRPIVESLAVRDEGMGSRSRNRSRPTAMINR